MDPVTGYAAYAGIGSRETPEHVLLLMQRLAAALAARGYTLRSGGASGADTAFALGAGSAPSEIFTPWRGFIKCRRLDLRAQVVTDSPYYHEALALAQQYHPRWDACSAGARKLHARNAMQVLGPDLRSPSRFVLCWTKTGGPYGGTGQALRMAAGCGVPVLNLQRPEDVRAATAQLLAA